MQLGRLAAWYGLDRLDAAGIRAFLPLLERLGYDTLWHPESRGYESFALDSFLLSNSSKLKIGSSITSIYARDAFAARRGMLTLNSLYGDRYILGLGVSHVPMVEGMRGHVYEKPIPAMRGYLDGISKDQAGSDEWPIMIAALRPLMLKVAAEKTRGALPYKLPRNIMALLQTVQQAARADHVIGIIQEIKVRGALQDGLGHFSPLQKR